MSAKSTMKAIVSVGGLPPPEDVPEPPPYVIRVEHANFGHASKSAGVMIPLTRDALVTPLTAVNDVVRVEPDADELIREKLYNLAKRLTGVHLKGAYEDAIQQRYLMMKRLNQLNKQAEQAGTVGAK